MFALMLLGVSIMGLGAAISLLKSDSSAKQIYMVDDTLPNEEYRVVYTELGEVKEFIGDIEDLILNDFDVYEVVEVANY